VMNSSMNSTISTLGAFKNGGIAQIVISFMHCAHPLLNCLFPLLNCHPLPNCAHPLSNSTLCSFSTLSPCPNDMSHPPMLDLFAIPEFAQCREVFLHAGWGPFLAHLQGHDDNVSLQFSLGFDGRMACMGSLTFLVSEESIASATKLPRVGDRWFKHHQLP
jgi:hypothetical protein